ncbi:hypothetical protein GIB67_024147, partial [Kingdonia uniflora]
VVISLACIILVGLLAVAGWFNLFQALDIKVTKLCVKGIIGDHSQGNSISTSHLWNPYFLKDYNELEALPILGSVKLMV